MPWLVCLAAFCPPQPNGIGGGGGLTVVPLWTSVRIPCSCLAELWPSLIEARTGDSCLNGIPADPQNLGACLPALLFFNLYSSPRSKISFFFFPDGKRET